MDQQKKLIILTGPTAVGKTDLSIRLAKAVGGEIISADSVQVYKHLDIGSAKIKKEEMQGVRHHLIDVLEPDAAFSVADFKQMALEAMEGIYAREHIPIIVGGTGFYIQAVLNDISFDETDDDGYRQTLEKMYNEEGAHKLYLMLQEIDPVSARSIHENNVKRVIRALEYHHQTGQKISDHNAAERKKVSPYNFAYFVLNMDREKLYERIEQRVDIMINDGLIDEVRELVQKYGLTRDMVSMQGLGYKEILQYLDHEYSLDEAVYVLKRDTRHFAKRQLTWFRRERDVIWVDKDLYTTEETQLAFMMDRLKERKIII
ncbi:MAG: tRNA (adenosine(37)-N6)-dimethylallyltransferase MiaA [Wujia sp.]